jgi:hypothetical protein
MGECDTRCYLGPRLRSSFGYDHLSSIPTGLAFNLPNFTNCNSRDVAVNGRRWELWSPNSHIVAYHPGKMREDYFSRIDDNRKLRRFDGSLGRFDPTIAPQCFDSKRPWLGFIVRLGQANNREPEFDYISRHWVSEHGTRYHGMIKNELLISLKLRYANLQGMIDKMSEQVKSVVPSIWRDRPSQVTSESVKRLEGRLVFQDAVDHLAAIQRDLKEKAAWVEMADRIFDRLELWKNTRLLQVTDIPMADDKFMGVWLNGADEETALWLLARGRVPCFIAHEYAIGVDELHHCNPQAEPSFIHGTNIPMITSPDHNPLDFIARRSNATVSTGSPADSGVVSTTNWTETEDHQSQSSSWSQGWNREFCRRENVLFRTPLSHNLPNTNFASRSLDEVILDPEKYPWICPPPIADISTGPWSHWWQDCTDDGEYDTCFLTHGKASANYLFLWYDRENMRILYLDESLDIPPGLISDFHSFGAPAPRCQYFEAVNNVRRLRRPSHWVYPTKTPQKSDKGRKAIPPNPSLLPPRDTNTSCKSAFADVSGKQTSGHGGGNVKHDMYDSDSDEEAMVVVKFPPRPSQTKGGPVVSSAPSNIDQSQVVDICVDDGGLETITGEEGEEVNAAELERCQSEEDGIVGFGRGDNFAVRATERGQTLEFDDKALWTKTGPLAPVQKPFWGFSNPVEQPDQFKLLFVDKEKKLVTRALPSQYAPIVAYLDVMYRCCITMARKVRKAAALASYLCRLRDAFQDEILAQTAEGTLWRSRILHEWASRTFLSCGHSNFGRDLYFQKVKKEGKEPYCDDHLHFGMCLFNDLRSNTHLAFLDWSAFFPRALKEIVGPLESDSAKWPIAATNGQSYCDSATLLMLLGHISVEQHHSLQPDLVTRS